MINQQAAFFVSKSLEAFGSLNLDLAQLYLKQAIKIAPKDPNVLRLLGVVAAQKNLYDEAILYFNASLRLAPKNSITWSNLGNVYLKLRNYDESIIRYDKSIKLDPEYDGAWVNKGNALQELKRFDEAIAHYDRALSMNPNYFEAWSNKGNALREIQRFDEAIAHYDQALSINPNYFEAWSNKGFTLHELQRFDEAIAHYDQALSINPNYFDALWNKSISLLIQGDFENGFSLYESRWLSYKASEAAGRRSFEKPTWLGKESLEGKTILLYGEQGLGDFIQFCRYVKLVTGLGAKVILEVPKSLASLMENLEGVSRLVIKGQELPAFDYQCPLLSLPISLNTSISSIPGYIPYLAVHPNRVAEWSLRLGEKRKKRIGLVWSSMSNFKDDSKRSLMLFDLIKALPSERFEYICLQKELKDCDKECFENYKNIRFFGDELIDFSDTAALIENIDLVISTCTSIPHLSGALGKETWLLLSYVPDWRWLLGRDDSPWYPSIRLYRQEAAGKWDEPLKKVSADLISLQT